MKTLDGLYTYLTESLGLELAINENGILVIGGPPDTKISDKLDAVITANKIGLCEIIKEINNASLYRGSTA